MLFAVEVADQPADIAEESGHAGALHHAFRDAEDADVQGDVLVQQCRIDAKIDGVRNPVGSVVGDDQDPAKARGAEDLEGFGNHRSAPTKVHHSGWADPILPSARSRS